MKNEIMRVLNMVDKQQISAAEGVQLILAMKKVMGRKSKRRINFRKLATRTFPINDFQRFCDMILVDPLMEIGCIRAA